MNTALGHAAGLRPTRRMLLELIAVRGGKGLCRRAERLVLRGMFRGWPERTVEQLLGRLLARVAGDFDPVRGDGRGLAGPCPGVHALKTPAAQEQVCRFAAASDRATSACGTAPRPVAGGGVV